MTEYVFSERLFWSVAHAEKFGTTPLHRIEDVEPLTEDDTVYIVGELKSVQGKAVMDFMELMGIPCEEVLPELLFFDDGVA